MSVKNIKSINPRLKRSTFAPSSLPDGIASLKQCRIGPRKVRLVANMVRSLSVSEAYRVLKFADKKAAEVVLKLIQSASANAKLAGADLDELYVSSINVDMGKTLKRFLPRAQGRATPIRKRSSHILVQVSRRS
jgi:large subunit ribosomal protein L22